MALIITTALNWLASYSQVLLENSSYSAYRELLCFQWDPKVCCYIHNCLSLYMNHFIFPFMSVSPKGFVPYRHFTWNFIYLFQHAQYLSHPWFSTGFWQQSINYADITIPVWVTETLSAITRLQSGWDDKFSAVETFN